MTHADEGFVSAALRLSAPLDEAALLALLDSAGPGCAGPRASWICGWTAA
ncbi:MAG: hypothetical protein ACLR0N_11275 [Bilophila wadsworthia]